MRRWWSSSSKSRAPSSDCAQPVGTSAQSTPVAPGVGVSSARSPSRDLKLYLSSREPDIQVWNVNLRGDRSLTLRHTRHNDRPLHDSAQEVLKHVARLWGFRVRLESVDNHDRVLQHWEVTPAPHHN